MKKTIKLCMNIWIEIESLLQKYHIMAYASQAAYFVLLSGIPIVMLAIIIMGAIFPIDVAETNVFIRQFVPIALQEFAKKFIDGIFNRSNIPLASLTTIFLMWAASNGIRSIGSGIQNIYGSYSDRSFIRNVVYSFLYTIAFIITIMLSLAILVFATPLELLIRSLLGGKGSLILTFLNLRSIIFFVALTFLFMLAYKSLAKSEITFWQQFPGAAIAAGGWILFSSGYSIYITYFSNYAYFYGSMGAAMLFMLWLYMCMNILLIGALINKLRLERTKK